MRFHKVLFLKLGVEIEDVFKRDDSVLLLNWVSKYFKILLLCISRPLHEFCGIVMFCSEVGYDLAVSGSGSRWYSNVLF